jgi:hypothetical protein
MLRDVARNALRGRERRQRRGRAMDAIERGGRTSGDRYGKGGREGAPPGVWGR